MTASVVPSSLEPYRVLNAPCTVYYIPCFVSDSEANMLWHNVYAAPKPKWTTLSARRLQNWGGHVVAGKGLIKESLPTWLSSIMERVGSLGVFGSDIQPNHCLVNEYLPGQGIMPHEDGPAFFPMVTTVTLGSHTMLDLYRHRRDSVERKCNDDDDDDDDGCEPEFSLLLEPNSLVMITDAVYKTMLHGIVSDRLIDKVNDTVINLSMCTGHRLRICTDDMITEENPDGQFPIETYCAPVIGDALRRSTRVSITIRYVPHVVANMSRLFKI